MKAARAIGETDLFGEAPRPAPPAPRPRERRAVPQRPAALPAPVPGSLANLSPGSRFDAEAYLADVVGGELLTYGGVAVRWPDGTQWVFATGEEPTITTGTDGVAFYTEAELDAAREEAREEGKEEAREDVLKEAEEEMQKAVSTAVDKVAERLLAQIPRRRFPGRLIRSRCGGRLDRRRWREPIEMDADERRDIEREAIEAEWTLTEPEWKKRYGPRLMR